MFVQGKQQPPQTNEPVQVLLTVADTEKHFDCIKGNGKASKLPKKKKVTFFSRSVTDLFWIFSLSHSGCSSPIQTSHRFHHITLNLIFWLQTICWIFARNKTKFKFQEVLSETYKIRNQQMTSNLRTLF